MKQTSISFLQTKIFKHKKLNTMKNYFETFKALHKASPEFKIGLLMLECPKFMLNTFMPKTSN